MQGIEIGLGNDASQAIKPSFETLEMEEAKFISRKDPDLKYARANCKHGGVAVQFEKESEIAAILHIEEISNSKYHKKWQIVKAKVVSAK